MSIPLAAVILSGGSGTRLWPLSREARPKQFWAFTSSLSLFQETALRAQALSHIEGIHLLSRTVVCNQAHRFLVAEQLRELGLSAEIVLEPCGRNTAPALTAAAWLYLKEGNDPVLAVMPSDHVIRNQQAFCTRLAEAVSLAQQGFLLTLGIVPTRPETGFGYLRLGPKLSEAAFRLDAFVEKPDLKTALEYLATGCYLWNSGIFVLRASQWLAAIERFRPDILSACQKAVENGRRAGEFFRLDPEAFAACPSDSIDYAVMEKLSGSPWQAAVLPLDAGWSDLGSWPAMWEVADADAEGNLIRGEVFAKRAKNCLIRAEGRFVAVLGVEGVIVVETKDAVLVASKDSAQEIREVAEYLKRSGRPEYLDHPKSYRPWGTTESIGEGEHYQVKRLMLRPGACVTTQLPRCFKHWIVVKGTARITCGEETFELSENQSLYVPAGVKHCLENPGQIPLEVIEVRCGAYLDDVEI